MFFCVLLANHIAELHVITIVSVILRVALYLTDSVERCKPRFFSNYNLFYAASERDGLPLAPVLLPLRTPGRRRGS